MAESILNGKSILAVDDEPDILAVLEEEIMSVCPRCTFDKATTYERANELINSFTYELVILDIMGVRGFDLLEQAVIHRFPAVMLTAHALIRRPLSDLLKWVLGHIFPRKNWVK